MKIVKTAVLFSVLLGTAAPVWAQACPGFPARGVQIIDQLYDGSLASGTDDDRRQLTKIYIEQLVYEFPSEGWSWKSADPGRPPSKDSIARVINGRLCNWDWQNGSTRRRSLQVGQAGDDITGQNPIHVDGVNHLGGTSTPNPNPSTGSTSSSDVDALLAILADHDKADADRHASDQAQVERVYADLVARINELKALLAARPVAVQPAPLPGVPPVIDNGSAAGSIGMFLVKYVLPAVGGLMAGAAAK